MCRATACQVHFSRTPMRGYMEANTQPSFSLQVLHLSSTLRVVSAGAAEFTHRCQGNRAGALETCLRPALAPESAA